MSATLSTRTVTKTVEVEEPCVTVTLTLTEAAVLRAVTARTNGFYLTDLYADLDKIPGLADIASLSPNMPSIDLWNNLTVVKPDEVKTYNRMSVSELTAVVDDQGHEDAYSFMPVRDHMRAGNKIHAIKALRDKAGCSLLTAKTVVDDLMDGYHYGSK